jgi:hypothetical protein
VGGRGEPGEQRRHRRSRPRALGYRVVEHRGLGGEAIEIGRDAAAAAVAAEAIAAQGVEEVDEHVEVAMAAAPGRDRLRGRGVARIAGAEGEPGEHQPAARRPALTRRCRRCGELEARGSRRRQTRRARTRSRLQLVASVATPIGGGTNDEATGAFAAAHQAVEPESRRSGQLGMQRQPRAIGEEDPSVVLGVGRAARRRLGGGPRPARHRHRQLALERRHLRVVARQRGSAATGHDRGDG